jgi:hypothetical protein
MFAVRKILWKLLAEGKGRERIRMGKENGIIDIIVKSSFLHEG